jgi:hypothetical protein
MIEVEDIFEQENFLTCFNNFNKWNSDSYCNDIKNNLYVVMMDYSDMVHTSDGT